MKINDILLEIKRQFQEEENFTAYGEPQAWIYLDNGRSIEVTHEEDGLDESDQFFTVRLYCTEAEFENQYFNKTIGVIDHCCSTNTSDVLNVDVLKSPLKNMLKINEIEKVKEVHNENLQG